MIKNTASQRVGVQMVSATDGSAFTGSVTVSVTVDAGTQATGSVGSGACTHEGNGYHTYAPAQAETNGDLIAFTFTGTGAVPQTVQVYTRAATPDVNVTTIEGSDATNQIRDAVVDDATRIDASALNTATGTSIPAILDDTDLIDDATSGLAKIATDVAAILVDTGTTLQAELDGIQADTEDIQSKIGSPAGASVSADIAAVKSETASILDDTDLIDDATSGLAKIATDVAAVLVDTAVIGAAGAGLTAVPWNASWDAEVQSEVQDALDATIADSIPSDGTRPSISSALLMLTRFMFERSVTSTTVTVTKEDGSTSNFTLTLDDATSPTSITRAT